MVNSNRHSTNDLLTESSKTNYERGPAKGGSHVARLNFKMSRVGVY